MRISSYIHSISLLNKFLLGKDVNQSKNIE